MTATAIEAVCTKPPDEQPRSFGRGDAIIVCIAGERYKAQVVDAGFYECGLPFVELTADHHTDQ